MFPVGGAFFPSDKAEHIGLLATSRLSDNVSGVKQFSSTLQRALVEERHFALAEAVAFCLAAARISEVRLAEVNISGNIPPN
jgi:hypothetical protein